MASHKVDHSRAHPSDSFADSAFEPQRGYEFDENSLGEQDQAHQNMAMFNGMGGQNPYLGMMNHFGDMGPHDTMFADVLESDAWGASSDGTDPTSTRALPNSSNPGEMWSASSKGPLHMMGDGRDSFPYLNSTQSEIVKARGSTVAEAYGNLTPPEDAMASIDAPKPDKPVLDRSERARNAAVQRHAKAKKRQGQKQSRKAESESDGSEGEGTPDKRERYREKNRAAAAKCRAKKKTHVEQVELDARSLETENTVLKAQVRELRNQHSELRNLALQHNAGVQNCQCGAIHQFNMSKAAEMASSFSRSSAPGRKPSHDGAPSSLTSPVGFARNVGGRASFGPSAMAYGGMDGPESVQMQMEEEEGFQDFLPNGEARSSFS